MGSSARAWERHIKRLASHTPQDPAVFAALEEARAAQDAGELALARYLGRLSYGAIGCNEDVEHRAFVLWVERDGLKEFPQLRWLHHSPNEAAYRGQQGKGVASGWPDFFLPWRVGTYIALAMELKGPGGRLSREQKLWNDHLEAQGCLVAVPHSFEAARHAVVTYLSGGAS